jgi:hypothetical protein
MSGRKESGYWKKNIRENIGEGVGINEAMVLINEPPQECCNPFLV